MLVRSLLVGCGGKKSWSRALCSSTDLVLLVFRLCASRWPMAVASSDGAYLFSVVSLRPVNGGRNPFWSALLRVEMAGENSAAWANATRSAGVFALRLIAGAAIWLHSVGGSCVALAGRLFRLVGGTTHRPFVFLGQFSLLPVGRVMVQLVLVKVTSQPWSHRGATAKRLL